MHSESQTTDHEPRITNHEPRDPNPYSTAPPEYLDWYDQLFHYDVLTVRQKLLAIAQRYAVEDESGYPRFYVVRPPKLALNFVVGFMAFAANLVFMFIAIRLFFFQQNPLAAIAVLVVGGNLTRLVAILLAPYRHLTVYASEAEDHPLLFMEQENKLALAQRYSLHDAFGVCVAVLVRRNIRSIFRRRWEAFTPDGRPICVAHEDRLLLALLRRYLGSMYGLLRTNFEFFLPDGSWAGEYNRKLTITDQYVLDLRPDAQRLLDRRVALAIAILLDSGEGR